MLLGDSMHGRGRVVRLVLVLNHKQVACIQAGYQSSFAQYAGMIFCSRSPKVYQLKLSIVEIFIMKIIFLHTKRTLKFIYIFKIFSFQRVKIIHQVNAKHHRDKHRIYVGNKFISLLKNSRQNLHKLSL